MITIKQHSTPLRSIHRRCYAEDVGPNLQKRSFPDHMEYTGGIIKLGHWAKISKEIKREDVKLFSELSGDKNPVHLDDNYAKNTQFKQCIAHGLLSGSFISAIAGTIFPGNGSIYISQNFNFKLPVYFGDTITAQVKLIELEVPRARGKFYTSCINQNGRIVIEGEAVALIPREKLEKIENDVHIEKNNKE